MVVLLEREGTKEIPNGETRMDRKLRGRREKRGMKVFQGEDLFFC